VKWITDKSPVQETVKKMVNEKEDACLMEERALPM
jgi:hypothetical protein